MSELWTRGQIAHPFAAARAPRSAETIWLAGRALSATDAALRRDDPVIASLAVRWPAPPRCWVY